MKLTIARWVAQQHQDNPRLPDLTPEQTKAVVGQVRGNHGFPLSRDQAVEMTGYPLQERTRMHRYAVSAGGSSWVVEVDSRGKNNVVVAILRALTPPAKE